jgi:hypothetical protein
VREGATAEEGNPPTRCLILVAAFRRGTDRRMLEAATGPIEESPLAPSPIAPWGVQAAGNFSKALALASYSRVRQHHAAILTDVAPMVIGTRMHSRGTRAFYRVRIPGGACVVLRS